jgi:hypothetical protein
VTRQRDNRGAPVDDPTAGAPSTDLSTAVQASLGKADTAVQVGGDVGGTSTAPTVTATHLAAALPLAQGGTAATSASAARTSLGLGTAAVMSTAQIAAITESVDVVGSSGAAVTVPAVTTATISRVTLTAACTLTFPTATAGQSLSLVLVQGGTGSYTVTWPAAVTWAGGTAPTLSTTVGATDYLTFICVDGSTWAGFVAGLDVQ